MSKRALIVINLQNDYCEGGPMAVKGALNIVPIVNRIKNNFDLVIFTRDWHPENHCTFINYGGNIQPHCIKESKGAELNSALELSNNYYYTYKETEPEYESNSVFYKSKYKNIVNEGFVLSPNSINFGENQEISETTQNKQSNYFYDNITSNLLYFTNRLKYMFHTDNSDIKFSHPNVKKNRIKCCETNVQEVESNIDNILKDNNIKDLYFCGLTFEYTVYESILDAYKMRYNIFLIEDAVTGVNKVKIDKCKKFLKNININIIKSTEIS